VASTDSNLSRVLTARVDDYIYAYTRHATLVDARQVASSSMQSTVHV